MLANAFWRCANTPCHAGRRFARCEGPAQSTSARRWNAADARFARALLAPAEPCYHILLLCQATVFLQRHRSDCPLLALARSRPPEEILAHASSFSPDRNFTCRTNLKPNRVLTDVCNVSWDPISSQLPPHKEHAHAGTPTKRKTGRRPKKRFPSFP